MNDGFRILLLVLVVGAAVSDVRSRRIPNWLTATGVAAGLLANTAAHGLPGLLFAGKGLLLGFGVYLALYCIRAMGAGDVKLMAAIGAIVGPAAWFSVFLATALAAGVIAVVWSLAKGRLGQTIRNVGWMVFEFAHLRAPYVKRAELDVRDSRALRTPHGVAILAGVVVCVIWSAKVW